MRVILQNMEKYLSLTVCQLKFIDSFQFTPQGLDKLAKTLEDDEFRYLSEACTSNHSGLFRREVSIPMIIWIVLIDLMRRNYPHKIRYSANCLVVHVQIQNTHTRLGCEMELNVLLLADFFEKSRKPCLELYSLDPIHYYTTPVLAWNAALRMSRVDLQLIDSNNLYGWVTSQLLPTHGFRFLQRKEIAALILQYLPDDGEDD